MTENYSVLAQDVEKKFEKWFDDPVPADILPVPDEENHSNHRIQRKRINNWQRLSELLPYGFEGAVFTGTGVGLIIMYLSFMGWYSNNWPSPIFFIILAVVIGFVGGLYRGFFYKLREGTFYKDKL